jgi:hypothetical protein
MPCGNAMAEAGLQAEGMNRLVGVGEVMEKMISSQ